MICHSLLSHAQSAKHFWLFLWHCPLLFCSWKTLVVSGSECPNSLLPILSFIFICCTEWHLLWKLKARSQWRWIDLKLKCSRIRFLERWHLSQEEKETFCALCISLCIRNECGRQRNQLLHNLWDRCLETLLLTQCELRRRKQKMASANIEYIVKKSLWRKPHLMLILLQGKIID